MKRVARCSRFSRSKVIIFLQDTNKNCASAPAKTGDRTFLESLRSATELLESIASNREPLREVPADERERFQRAIAEAYVPDPIARRRRAKAVARERAAARVQRTEGVLNETEIR